MKAIKNPELLSALIEESNQLNAAISHFLKDKEESLLRYRHSPQKWNVLDCLEHLSSTFRLYIPRIEEAINKGSQIKGDQYKPGFFGQMMINSMTPSKGRIRMKVKTLRPFIPQTKEKSKEQIIQEFMNHQQKLIRLMEGADALHLGKLKVASAIGPVFKFKLGDCFRFLTGHNQRHWIQAQEAYRLAREKEERQPSSKRHEFPM